MEKSVAIFSSPHYPFNRFLFGRDDQILSQGSDQKIWFYLLEDQKPVGRFILHISNHSGISPFRAPFGSFELSKKIDFSGMDLWIKEVIRYSREMNLKSILIASYPFCYDQANSHIITSALTANDFVIQCTDLNFHLDLNKDFESGIHESEKRRLKKSESEGFKFELLDLEKSEAVHDLIRKSRERKGFPLSMKKDEFAELLIKFPSDYILFGLYDKQKLIAVSVGVRVSEEILYDFLPADDENYKSFSPVVLLKKEIVGYCKSKSFKIFDLGIATAEGVPNPGLIRFKENLGAIPSLKLTFSLNLSKSPF